MGMTVKKAEMAKTLRNGLSMIETNPLNHIWSDLVILLGLSLNRFQKKLLLIENRKVNCDFFGSPVFSIECNI